MFRLRVEVKRLPSESTTGLDRAVDLFVGRPCVGSGFEFDTGMRDREYEFDSERDAKAAAKRATTSLRRRGHTVRVTLHPLETSKPAGARG